MRKHLLILFATLYSTGSLVAYATTVSGTSGRYEVSSDRTTTLPTSGNSGYYVLEQWNYANNKNYRYVEENVGKVRYTTASDQSSLTEANIVLITNTGSGYTVKFVKTGNYIQNITASGAQATTGSSSSNLNFVASPTTGGYNIYNYDTNTNLLFFTLQNNNYPTGGTGRYAWGTFALYSVTKLEDYSSSVETYIKPHFDYADHYFGLKSTALSTYESDYNNYKVSCTEGEFNTLLNNVKALYSNLDNVYLPEDGYYRFKNKDRQTYLYYENEANGMYVGDKANAISSVVFLHRIDNTFSLKLQGKYIQQPGATNGNSANLGNEEVFFTPQISAPDAALGYAAISSGGRCISANASSKVWSWGMYATASHWTIEEAEDIAIALTAANDNTGAAHTYATLCVPFDISGLTGADSKEVKAYTSTKSGDYIVPGVGTTTIAAGTPVILIGEEGATSVTATIESSYANSPATGNVLTGTYTATTIDCTAGSGNYVLGFDADNDNRIGFYHVSVASSFDLKSNRAYLHLDGGSNVRGFAISFGELVDGIESIDIAKENGIYNLLGQRMGKLQQGVNIVNGKKVLVK